MIVFRATSGPNLVHDQDLHVHVYDAKDADKLYIAFHIFVDNVISKDNNFMNTISLYKMYVKIV